MITKFVEPWILIPGNVVVLLAFLSFLQLRATRWMDPAHQVRSRAIGMTMAAVALALWVASTGLGADATLGNWERRVEAAEVSQMRRASAVVFLGGGIVARSPAAQQISELTGEAFVPAALSASAETRLIHAAILARELELPLITSGGRVWEPPPFPAEAEVGAAWSRLLGVPETQIIEETGSRTTAENARFTAQLAPSPKVVLVTSAYHMPRAVAAFRQAGMEPLPAPAGYMRDLSGAFHVRKLLPSLGNLHATGTALREWVGILWYQLRAGRNQ